MFKCDNFCTSKNVVMCECEEAGNPFGKTVWKLSNTTTSCSIVLNRTGACNVTSGTCATFPGITAVNDPVMMDGASCFSSILYLNKSNSLEGLQINCMSHDGTLYGGIGFSTGTLLILLVCMFVILFVLYHKKITTITMVTLVMEEKIDPMEIVSQRVVESIIPVSRGDLMYLSPWVEGIYCTCHHG